MAEHVAGIEDYYKYTTPTHIRKHIGPIHGTHVGDGNLADRASGFGDTQFCFGTDEEEEEDDDEDAIVGSQTVQPIGGGGSSSCCSGGW